MDEEQIHCPSCNTYSTADTAYIAQNRNFRYFCCSLPCARLATEDDTGPWIILPPTGWAIEPNLAHVDTSDWRPILVEEPKMKRSKKR